MADVMPIRSNALHFFYREPVGVCHPHNTVECTPCHGLHEAGGCPFRREYLRSETAEHRFAASP